MKKRVALACTVCGTRNYSTDKNMVTVPERLELKKFCKRCNTQTIHRETK